VAANVGCENQPIRSVAWEVDRDGIRTPGMGHFRRSADRRSRRRRRARSPQSASAIGWELLAVAVLSGAVLFVLDRRAGHAREPGIARYVERFSPNTITAILVAVAEVTVIAGAGGGFYWLIPAVAANLIGGVVNAWQFLVRLPS
jgi:hypothetical protein